MQHNNGFLTLVQEYENQVQHIQTHEVKAKLKQPESFVLIDVRETHEWQQGHLPHAKHMSRGTIEVNIEQIIPNKNTNIVLYCGGGYRSVLSAYNLQKMGYNNVYSMDGGFRSWLTQDYSVVID
jgi:rhodanese-related sulfurtransferase